MCSTPPPHAGCAPVVGTVSPEGSVSVNPTPVSATVLLGFVRVKVREVVPFSAMFGAPKALAIDGGATTVMVAVLLVVPVPPLVEVIAPVVLFLTRRGAGHRHADHARATRGDAPAGQCDGAWSGRRQCPPATSRRGATGHGQARRQRVGEADSGQVVVLLLFVMVKAARTCRSAEWWPRQMIC